MVLKRNLRALRQNEGWTQELTAEKLSIPHSHIVKYENSNYPKLPTLLVIFKFWNAIHPWLKLDQLLESDLTAKLQNKKEQHEEILESLSPSDLKVAANYNPELKETISSNSFFANMYAYEPFKKDLLELISTELGRHENEPN